MTIPILGIDLGTTNSVVAYTDDAGTTHVIADENGDRTIPSVIHFTDDGDYVVGRHAKDYAEVQPDRVAKVFKRGMGTPHFQKDDAPFVVDQKTWTPEELSSLVLRKLANMADKHFEQPVPRAVITVPYYFGEPERAATRSAGEIAGLEVLSIVNEPTAAAVAHGVDHGESTGTLLVFDLGGGTFDVTVMRYGAGGEMEVVATGGDRELGGADFDDLIVEKMTQFARSEAGVELADDPWLLADASARAEEMKKELSTSTSSTKRLAVGGRPLMFTLTRDELHELIEEQVQFVEDAVLGTLDDSDMSGSDIDDVLMVGGSSRMPVWQEMMQRVTGREPRLTKNLDEDVARGAAMLGAKQGGGLDPRSELAQRPQPRDAASHALGLTLFDPDTQRQYNQVIIPAATPVPHSATHTFGTVADNQTEIDMVLNEGGDEDLDFVRELSRSNGRFSRPVGKGHPLRCEVEYTAEQLVVVTMYDGVTSEHLCDIRVEHTGMLSDEAKDEARAFLAQATVR